MEAREQFIQDYLLVTENVQDSYYEHISLVSGMRILEASEIMRDRFEEWVVTLANKEEERGNELGALLLKQLLLGYGSDTFYAIAERFDEIGSDIADKLNA